MPIASENKSRTRSGVTDGSEMTTTSDGNVDSGDVRVPDTVAYRLATLTWSGGALSKRWNDSYFEIVLSVLKASNIARRALSRLCF